MNFFLASKNVALGLAWGLPFLIFLVPEQFARFGQIGFWMLIYVLCMGQLVFIFPKVKLFARLLFFRGAFGVFCGMMILGHFAGYLMVNDLRLFEVLGGAFYWNFRYMYAWGLLGILAVLPVLFTSNKMAMRVLGKWWKKVQKLSYLFLFFGAVHVVIGGELYAIAGVGMVILMRVLKYFGVRF